MIQLFKLTEEGRDWVLKIKDAHNESEAIALAKRRAALDGCTKFRTDVTRGEIFCYPDRGPGTHIITTLEEEAKW